MLYREFDMMMKKKARNKKISALVLCTLMCLQGMAFYFPRAAANPDAFAGTLVEGHARWFEINVNAGTNVDVGINWTSTAHAFYLYLYDESHVLVATNASPAATMVNITHTPFIVGNYSVKILAVQTGGQAVPFDGECNYAVTPADYDAFAGQVAQTGAQWFEININNSRHPVEVNLFYDHSAVTLTMTLYDAGNTAVTATVTTTGNRTTLLHAQGATVLGTYFLRVNGTTVANGTTSYSGECNFNVTSRAAYTLQGSVSTGSKASFGVTIAPGSMMLLEIRVVWTNPADALNLTMSDQVVTVTRHPMWASLVFTSHAGLGSFQFDVEGLTFASGTTIGFTLEANYAMTSLTSGFSGAIRQSSSRWYAVQVTEAQFNIEISVSWNAAADDLDLRLFGPWGDQTALTVTRTTTSTSETITHAPTFEESYYLEIVGTTVSSAALITYNGTTSFNLIAMGPYTVTGTITADAPAWVDVDLAGGLSGIVDANVFWDASGGVDLDAYLWDPADDLAVFDDAGTGAVAAIQFHPLWEGVHVLEIRANGTTTFTVECNLEVTLESASLGAFTVSPNRGGNAGTVRVTITGDNFPNNVVVKLTRTGHADIVGRDTYRETPSQLVSQLNLEDRAAGSWDVVLAMPDGTEQRLANAFTILEGGAPELWTDVVGRQAVRIGRDQDFWVYVGNRGEVDLYDCLLFVSVPTSVQCRFDVPVPKSDTNKDWSSVPTSTVLDGQQVTVLYIYCLRAFSTQKLRLTLNTGPNYPENDPDAFKVKLIPSMPSNFSKTGDMDAFNTSTVIKPIMDYWAQQVLDGNTQPPTTGPRLASIGDILRNIATRYGLIFLSMACLELAAGIGAGLAATALAAAGWAGLALAAGMALYGAWNLGYALGKSLPGWGRSAGRWLYKWWYGEQALDPNEKVGPTGVGDAHFIAPGRPFPYVIYFENLATASAAAQEVNVTDVLSPHLDWATFNFTEVTLGNETIPLPGDSFDVDYLLDLRPTRNVSVELNLTFDPLTGRLNCYMRGINTTTGALHPDGFLPPNQNSPEGEGHVAFVIWPDLGLSSGTNVTNNASIVFDVNAPILTNTWGNVIDGIAPMSTLTARPGFFSPTEIAVSWSGTDGAGAGVATYTVQVSDNGGNWTTIAYQTNATSMTYEGQAGHTYQFRVAATDAVGNQEAAHATADATATPSYTGLVVLVILVVAGVVLVLVVLLRRKKKAGGPTGAAKPKPGEKPETTPGAKAESPAGAKSDEGRTSPPNPTTENDSDAETSEKSNTQERPEKQDKAEKSNKPKAPKKS